MPQTPRLIELSLAVYRLLLAAYPAGFRQEYGEAMAQLFRDTALDGYRQRGHRGLLGVWLRTLGDFTISVVRQHREETAITGASPSLQHLAQQWLTLAAVLLSVMLSTLRYALHLILRRPLRTCAVASAMIFLLWGWSLFGHSGLFNMNGLPLPVILDLQIHNGVFEFRHTYRSDPPISQEFFRQNPKYRNHLIPAKPWEFGFSSGYWIYSDSHPRQYSLIRIPVPILFVFVLVFYAATRRIRLHYERGMP
jgi:hypothetical protein